jgi:hypothetical protein
MEFAAVREFRGLTQEQRIKKAHAIVDRVRPMAVLAIEVVSMEKSDLIEAVEDKYEIFGQFLMDLADATKQARSLLEVISAAECRLAVALAVVEGDDNGRRRFSCQARRY